MAIGVRHQHAHVAAGGPAECAPDELPISPVHAIPLQLEEIGLPAFADPGPERQPDAVAHLRMFGRRSGLRNATGRSTYWTPLQTGESTRYRARNRSRRP